MDETEFKDSLTRLVADESPYKTDVASSLRAFRAQNRRRRMTVAGASALIGMAAVAGGALALPALKPAPADRSNGALAASTESKTDTPPDTKPKTQTKFEDSAKTAIMNGIQSVSPPQWTLDLSDDISPREGRGWEGWHVAGTVDDGQGKSQLGVGVQVGSQKFRKELKLANPASPGSVFEPGTCPPDLGSTTCTATTQPDGRVLLVIRDVSPEVETRRVRNLVMLVDVEADVTIAAESENYASPDGKRAAPNKERAARATRAQPAYDSEMLTKLVMEVGRNIPPSLRAS